VGKKTNSQFIKDSKKVHANKYTYDKTIYNGSHSRVTITCPIHGDYPQLATSHLSGNGCPKCGIELSRNSKFQNKDNFVTKAKEIHGQKYDYSLFQYKSAKTKSTIICHKHGSFLQHPNNHLSGKGCKKCADDQMAITRSDTAIDFINKAKFVHGNLYLYEKILNIENHHCKVKIICLKHGGFLQTPNAHLMGHGCPRCKKIVLKNGFVCDSKVEAYYLMKLIKSKVNFYHNLVYPNCPRNFKYDFYIPSENKYIEITS
jgi:hypothetical protein